MKDISLIGFMGCGKSSVGKELAALLPECRLIDLDTYIEESQGMSIPEIFNEYGEAAFRRMEREALNGIFSDTGRPRAILSLGGGTVTSEECRRLIRQNTECFYLRATTETLLDNLEGHSAGRPMLAVPVAEPASASRQAPIAEPPKKVAVVRSVGEPVEPHQPVEAHRRTSPTVASTGSATRVNSATGKREALRQRIEDLMSTRSSQYLDTAHHVIDIDGQTFAQTAAIVKALL